MFVYGSCLLQTCVCFTMFNWTVFDGEQVEQTEEKMEGADQPAADVEGQKEGGYEDEMPIDGEFQVLDSVGDTDGIEGEGQYFTKS